MWPTATTTDAKSSARHGYMIEGNAGTTLLDAARGWPTPTTAPDAQNRNSNVRNGPPSLGPMARGWPTPVRADGERGPSSVYPRGNHGLAREVQGWTPDSAHWPTPDAAVSNDGEDPETFLARKEHHATRTDREPTRAGVPLALAVKWATPTTPGGGAATRSGARGDELLLPGQAAAWATPRATEGEKGGPNGRDGSGSAHLASQAATWPTPVANDGKGPQPVERPEGDDSLSTRVSRTKPGLVLNPVFVEALMGWPLGWTDPLRPSGPSVPFPPPPKGDWGTYLASYPGTEPAVPKVERAEVPDGAPRTDRLRACGNGVVPAQAAAAIGELFDALGVGQNQEEIEMGKSEHTRSKNDEVCTPKGLLDAVRMLEPIGFDPCSAPASIVDAATTVLLPKYWTDPMQPPPAEQECGDQLVLWGDGLQYNWGGMGLVFVNPPYSLLAKQPWIAKARDEADEAVLFLPVRTAGAWWQDEVTRCQAVTFLRGRVVHEGEEDGAPFHQCLVYCGPRVERWIEIVTELQLGWTVLGEDWKRGV